ncbi:hypothetical protein BDN72DRAFT_641312 [Pluteus cervinus]|uniref:Uncharacterized protein n=1 Tax=Pluteus cervinus TaxID=181527 RepID=A0ACD3ATQ7_9AGAR|nr:hypothetical protein BDN72DRAFT_641312 [Pluteus cervinus]
MIPVTSALRVYAYGARVMLGSFSEKKLQILDWQGWFAKKQKQKQRKGEEGGERSNPDAFKLESLTAKQGKSSVQTAGSSSKTPSTGTSQTKTKRSNPASSSLPSTSTSTSTSASNLSKLLARPSSSRYKFVHPWVDSSGVLVTTEPPAPVQEIYTGEDGTCFVFMKEDLVGVQLKVKPTSLSAERIKVFKMNPSF